MLWQNYIIRGKLLTYVSWKVRKDKW